MKIGKYEEIRIQENRTLREIKRDFKAMTIFIIIVIILALIVCFKAIGLSVEYKALKKEKENLENKVEIQQLVITELRKILINDYGSEKFWELIDKD